MTDVQTPWYLAGNYGPVADELTELDLPVTGADPAVAVRALPAQRAEPGERHVVALVLRRRHGPRRPPRGRPRRVVPQPVGAHDQADERAGGDGRRVDVRPDGERGEHPRPRPRRADLGAGGGPPALRAVAGAGHDRLRRLRRSPHDGVHGAPEAVPGDGRAALLRLRRAAAVPHVPRAVGRRRAGPLGADHRRQADDDARLHDHARARRVHGPARACSTSTPSVAASRRSGGTTTTARGSASCRGWGPTPMCAGSRSTRATCSTRSTPTPRGRRWCATSAGTPRCGGSRWTTSSRRSCTAGRSTWRPAR